MIRNCLNPIRPNYNSILRRDRIFYQWVIIFFFTLIILNPPVALPKEGSSLSDLESANICSTPGVYSAGATHWIILFDDSWSMLKIMCNKSQIDPYNDRLLLANKVSNLVCEALKYTNQKLPQFDDSNDIVSLLFFSLKKREPDFKKMIRSNCNIISMKGTLNDLIKSIKKVKLGNVSSYFDGHWSPISLSTRIGIAEMTRFHKECNMPEHKSAIGQTIIVRISDEKFNTSPSDEFKDLKENKKTKNYEWAYVCFNAVDHVFDFSHYLHFDFLKNDLGKIAFMYYLLEAKVDLQASVVPSSNILITKRTALSKTELRDWTKTTVIVDSIPFDVDKLSIKAIPLEIVWEVIKTKPEGKQPFDIVRKGHCKVTESPIYFDNEVSPVKSVSNLHPQEEIDRLFEIRWVVKYKLQFSLTKFGNIYPFPLYVNVVPRATKLKPWEAENGVVINPGCLFGTTDPVMDRDLLDSYPKLAGDDGLADIIEFRNYYQHRKVWNRALGLIIFIVFLIVFLLYFFLFPRFKPGIQIAKRDRAKIILDFNRRWKWENYSEPSVIAGHIEIIDVDRKWRGKNIKPDFHLSFQIIPKKEESNHIEGLSIKEDTQLFTIETGDQFILEDHHARIGKTYPIIFHPSAIEDCLDCVDIDTIRTTKTLEANIKVEYNGWRFSRKQRKKPKYLNSEDISVELVLVPEETRIIITQERISRCEEKFLTHPENPWYNRVEHRDEEDLDIFNIKISSTAHCNFSKPISDELKIKETWRKKGDGSKLDVAGCLNKKIEI